MSEAKHTPGPWDLAWEDGKHGVVATGIGKLVCIIANNDPDDGLNDMRRANARLIATAPEGLALAKLVVEFFGPIDDLLDGDIRLRDAARALIAKAEGGA